MKTIKERLVCIETEVRLIKKMLYGLFVLVAGTAGIQII